VTAYPQAVWKQAVLHAPAWVLLGVGLVLVTLAWWPLVSGRLLTDWVVDPRTGADMVPGPRWLLGVVRWGLPVGLACVVLIAVLFGGAG
jgi:hypothetical protein